MIREQDDQEPLGRWSSRLLDWGGKHTSAPCQAFGVCSFGGLCSTVHPSSCSSHGKVLSEGNGNVTVFFPQCSSRCFPVLLSLASCCLWRLRHLGWHLTSSYMTCSTVPGGPVAPRGALIPFCPSVTASWHPPISWFRHLSSLAVALCYGGLGNADCNLMVLVRILAPTRSRFVTLDK